MFNFVGVPHREPIHQFSPNFGGISSTQEDLEVIRFWRISGKGCCHGLLRLANFVNEIKWFNMNKPNEAFTKETLKAFQGPYRNCN